MSSRVLALLLPPTSSVRRSNCSLARCFVLLNMRCSKRCAKPERPAGSSLPPTPYHTCTLTVGLERSSTATTRRPLASVRSRKSSGGMDSATDALGTADTAGAAPWAMAVMQAQARRKRGRRIEFASTAKPKYTFASRTAWGHARRRALGNVCKRRVVRALRTKPAYAGSAEVS